MTFQECCEAVLADRHNKALNYAVNYAEAGRHMSGKMASVQALYLLNNITYWRGDTAKAVRAALRDIGKGA
jgi:hypothetical protein